MGVFIYFSEAYAGVVSVWAIESILQACLTNLAHPGLLLWLAGWIWSAESDLWILASTKVCKVAAVLIGIELVLTSINVAGVLPNQISKEQHALTLRERQADSNAQAFRQRESAGNREVRAQSAENLPQLGTGV